MAYENDNGNGIRPEQPQPPKKNSDIGSWIFIAVMFAVWWPIGLIMLLSKLSEGGGKKKNTRAHATRLLRRGSARPSGPSPRRRSGRAAP